jgi:hypothetical protein
MDAGEDRFRSKRRHTLAGLLSQLPGDKFLDATRSKRVIVALGVIVVALCAIIIEFRPSFPLVLIALACFSLQKIELSD